jgi:hypothetical protein
MERTQENKVIDTYIHAKYFITLQKYLYNHVTYYPKIFQVYLIQKHKKQAWNLIT